MNSQTVTLELPEPLYERLRNRAAQSQRSIEAEARETLASALQESDSLPADLEAAITPLALLSDAELWQAGCTRLSQETVEQLEELNLKRQREGLTEAEEATAAGFIHQYERVMLIRAEAAALLKQRGHDVAPLLRKA